MNADGSRKKTPIYLIIRMIRKTDECEEMQWCVKIVRKDDEERRGEERN